MADNDPRRQIPRTDDLLADPRLLEASDRLGPAAVKRVVLAAQQRAREGAIAGGAVLDEAVATLPAAATSLRAVLNATGVVLHTNLGRAPLSVAARAAVLQAAGYVDVEFDLGDGQRARRGRGALAALQDRLPDAGDVLVVNNGAAALLLAATALGAGRELIISRGELVEIGDGFRLPDLIESAGATIREVGTTNRVRLADFADAIGPNTAGIVKIHPSNFRIEGFTSAVATDALATLPVPLIVDVGSGLLSPLPLLPDEPDVRSALRAGAGLVTASGDKLLGGPQAGLIAGHEALIARLRRHPMARALRVDKLTLAALEATLDGPVPPVARYLHADAGQLRARCLAIAAPLGAEVVPSGGAVGGGGAPGVILPGWAVALPAHYSAILRQGRPPIITRVEHDRCLIDLRCLDPADDATVVASVRAISAGRPVR
jgi:L-seryl-tRNA(Ser) seleniumtransferase